MFNEKVINVIELFNKALGADLDVFNNESSASIEEYVISENELSELIDGNVLQLKTGKMNSC